MAANPERQEVDLVVNRRGPSGETVEKVYLLKQTTSSSIALEAKTKQTTGQIMQSLSQLSITSMRDLLHSLLQENHGAEFPNSDKGMKSVEKLMDDVGHWKKLIPIFVEVFGVKDKEAEEGPNPPEAQAGIGDSSTLTLVESA